MERLSEELKYCLDHSGCGECNNYQVSSILTCQGLSQKIYERIKEYEDLEEQGKLLKLPCAVGSEVWYIDKYAECIEIVRGVVEGYSWYRSCGFALNVVWDKRIMGFLGYKRTEIRFSEIGKTVFLTKEDAEAALKEMKK